MFSPLLYIFFYMKKQTAPVLLVIFQWRRVASVTFSSNALPHAVTVKSVCCQTVVGCQSSCLFDKVWEGFGGRWRHRAPLDSAENSSPR